MSDLDPRGLEAAAHAVWESIDDRAIRGRLYSEDCDHVAATAVRAYLEHAQSVVEAVLDLHVEREWRPLDGMYLGGTSCDHCRRSWPCPTVQTLTTAPHSNLTQEGDRNE